MSNNHNLEAIVCNLGSVEPNHWPYHRRFLWIAEAFICSLQGAGWFSSRRAFREAEGGLRDGRVESDRRCLERAIRDHGGISPLRHPPLDVFSPGTVSLSLSLSLFFSAQHNTGQWSREHAIPSVNLPVWNPRRRFEHLWEQPLMYVHWGLTSGYGFRSKQNGVFGIRMCSDLSQVDLLGYEISKNRSDSWCFVGVLI